MARLFVAGTPRSSSLALVVVALSLARCSLPHAALRGEDGASNTDSTATDSTLGADGSDAQPPTDARDAVAVEDARDGSADADAAMDAADAADVVDAADVMDAADAMDVRSMDVTDSGVPMDSGVADSGVPTDSGITDSSAARDTGVVTDSGVRPVRCADVVAADRSTNVVTLYNGTTPWQAYCDFAAPDGPWTLIAKVSPTDNEWRFDAGRWEDTNLLNETTVDLSRASAKYQGFLTLPFTAARLSFVTDQLNGAADPFATRTVGFAFNSGTRSMRGVLRDGGNDQLIMGTTAADWLGAIPTVAFTIPPLLDSMCTRTAFNSVGAGGSGGHRVRIGIFGDDSADCRSPSSWIGVGGNPTSGVGGAIHVAGNRREGSITIDERRTPSWVFIWVR